MDIGWRGVTENYHYMDRYNFILCNYILLIHFIYYIYHPIQIYKGKYLNMAGKNGTSNLRINGVINFQGTRFKSTLSSQSQIESYLKMKGLSEKCPSSPMSKLVHNKKNPFNFCVSLVHNLENNQRSIIMTLQNR